MRPDDVAAQWLAYAESDLAIAYGVDRPGVLAESLCFHAQQAGDAEPVDADEHARAVDVASSVVEWARSVLAGLRAGSG